METRIAEQSFPWIQRIIGLQLSTHMVPTEKLFGGIILIWRKGLGAIDFTHGNGQAIFGIISKTRNIHTCWVRPMQILVEFNEFFGRRLRLLPLYNCSFYCSLFAIAPSIAPSLHLLLLIRYFNYILNAFDKKSDKLFYIDHDVREFQAFVWSNRLIGPGFQGPTFFFGKEKG